MVRPGSTGRFFLPPTMIATSPWRLCVAPMMEWTTSPCRIFHRQLSLQLGGSEPGLLAQAAKIGADLGYDEVNLNCGCPSERVQNGAFGACLMREPALVADCVSAMRAAVDIPVTVKCRIGGDEQDDDEGLYGFIDTVRRGGCEVFIVHARKAWLKGLSPKENREIPPLNYERVHRLRDEFPELTIVLNGGVTTRAAANAHAADFAGIMLGRTAYHEPYLLAELERDLFDPDYALPDRADVLRALYPHIDPRVARGESIAQAVPSP